jgi:hypothetical protein
MPFFRIEPFLPPIYPWKDLHDGLRRLDRFVVDIAELLTRS